MNEAVFASTAKARFGSATTAAGHCRRSSSRDPAEGIALPRVVREYRLTALLGQGAYGRVYRAEHMPTGTPVAVKVYARCALSTTREASIKNEVKVLLAVDHPNIVKFVDCFVADERIFIVMELLDGEDLHAHCRRGLPAAGRRAFGRAVLGQLGSALAYLHARRIAHRDVKLDNLMLDRRSGVLKLVDFGFSKRLAAGAREQLSCGTPRYMAPEAAAREASSCFPADVWAAGVVYHCVLLGHFPFSGKTPGELAAQIAAGKLDPAADPLLRRCLARDWRQRVSARELCDLLAAEAANF